MRQNIVIFIGLVYAQELKIQHRGNNFKHYSIRHCDYYMYLSEIDCTLSQNHDHWPCIYTVNIQQPTSNVDQSMAHMYNS